jgi:hypothetical protein
MGECGELIGDVDAISVREQDIQENKVRLESTRGLHRASSRVGFAHDEVPATLQE